MRFCRAGIGERTGGSTALGHGRLRIAFSTEVCDDIHDGEDAATIPPQ
jgi:hypothetical protein